MSSARLAAAAALSLSLGGAAAAQTVDRAPGADSYSALVNVVVAGEVVLRDVCLPGILERKPVAALAQSARLLPVPSRSAGAGAGDSVYRLASLTPVQAVEWADGTCTTFVDTGPVNELRKMAERVILARPEGFMRGRHALEGGGRVERTVYCAREAGNRLVVSISTPTKDAPRSTRALSSTVYRAPGWSPLCDPTPDA